MRNFFRLLFFFDFFCRFVFRSFFSGIFGKSFFRCVHCQSEFGLLLFELVETEFVECGNERYSEEHTHNSEETSADCYGSEYPYSGETDRCSDNLRIEYIIVYLLEDNQEHEEYKCLCGADCADDEGTESSTDESSDDRYEGGDADDSTSHSRVGEAQDRRSDERESADEDSFDELTDEEICEGLVSGREEVVDASVGSFTEVSELETLNVVVELVLAEKQVNCEDKTDNDIGHGRSHRAYEGDD